MVSRKADQRKTITIIEPEDRTETLDDASDDNLFPKKEAPKQRNNRLRNFLIVTIVVLLILTIAVGVFFALKHFLYDNYLAVNETNLEIEPTAEPKKEEVVLPDKIDFQPVVDSWVNSVGGNKSVLIYDLERNEVVGEYNSKENYSTASLYKLFVVYEGYRRVQSGEWNGDDSAGYTGNTVLECLDLAIRESNSSCAEALWDKIGRKDLENIIENDYGITDSDILDLVSNPQDIMKMMKIYYEHKDITDENLIARMKDSFLNQPETTYNWRQGLPSGFKNSTVYNKVGWDFNPDENVWNLYHDAAIVEIPDKSRHFIVVAMTNDVPYQNISRLGSMIEEQF